MNMFLRFHSYEINHVWERQGEWWTSCWIATLTKWLKMNLFNNDCEEINGDGWNRHSIRTWIWHLLNVVVYRLLLCVDINFYEVNNCCTHLRTMLSIMLKLIKRSISCGWNRRTMISLIWRNELYSIIHLDMNPYHPIVSYSRQRRSVIWVVCKLWTLMTIFEQWVQLQTIYRLRQNEWRQQWINFRK